MVEVDDIDEDLGERDVLLVRIFPFNTRNFPKSINGISFLSISSTHIAHTIKIVSPRSGNFKLQMLSSHTPRQHLLQLSVILAASHMSHGSYTRLLKGCSTDSRLVPYLYIILISAVLFFLYTIAVMDHIISILRDFVLDRQIIGVGWFKPRLQNGKLVDVHDVSHVL
jgi:hypothetical protein